ncbi:hypothetical protein HPB48_026950 [Haemaphysalis longicornis]|uniref:Uncharacterized protein n=1 Tax=Haemaphysalis longicornis TaxID=44386 RepID=A0A9J6HDG7_HAELO|nr:hypothetical protein HPB48_026950 [Haemaphysalis longicornis]
MAMAWRDEEMKSPQDSFQRGLRTGLKQPSGKVARLIVTRIGNEDGFVDGFLSLSVLNGTKSVEYIRRKWTASISRLGLTLFSLSCRRGVLTSLTTRRPLQAPGG